MTCNLVRGEGVHGIAGDEVWEVQDIAGDEKCERCVWLLMVVKVIFPSPRSSLNLDFLDENIILGC